MKFTNNSIKYYQDFRCFTGIPVGVEFEVKPFTKTMVKLVAPGYGSDPYGNGALYVSKLAMQFSQHPNKSVNATEQAGPPPQD